MEQESPQDFGSVSRVILDRTEYSCMTPAKSGVKLAILRPVHPLAYSGVPLYPSGSCCATARAKVPEVGYLTLLCTIEALWFRGPRRRDRTVKIHAIHGQLSSLFRRAADLRKQFCPQHENP
ncbi:hypothetical protein IG631_11426 [Alternaria alternata]|nr:hypothetical protein IG631_11426 [Alternaria alternata]